jgi:hypothetical protein
MSVNGQIQAPFSGRTKDLIYPATGEDVAKECVAAALKKYCLPVRGHATTQAAL